MRNSNRNGPRPFSTSRTVKNGSVPVEVTTIWPSASSSFEPGVPAHLPGPRSVGGVRDRHEGVGHLQVAIDQRVQLGDEGGLRVGEVRRLAEILPEVIELEAVILSR